MTSKPHVGTGSGWGKSATKTARRKRAKVTVRAFYPFKRGPKGTPQEIREAEVTAEALRVEKAHKRAYLGWYELTEGELTPAEAWDDTITRAEVYKKIKSTRGIVETAERDERAARRSPGGDHTFSSLSNDKATGRSGSKGGGDNRSKEHQLVDEGDSSSDSMESSGGDGGTTFETDDPPEVKGGGRSPTHLRFAYEEEEEEENEPEVVGSPSVAQVVWSGIANTFNCVTEVLSCHPTKSKKEEMLGPSRRSIRSQGRSNVQRQGSQDTDSHQKGSVGSGNGSRHRNRLKERGVVRLELRVGEMSDEDSKRFCHLVPDGGVSEFGKYGILLSASKNSYAISTFKPKQWGEEALNLYQQESYYETLKQSILEIIAKLMKDSHEEVVIPLCHEKCGVSHRQYDQSRFVPLMGTMIRQVVEQLEEQTAGVSFTIIIYFSLEEQRRLFEEYSSPLFNRGQDPEGRGDSDDDESQGRQQTKGTTHSPSSAATGGSATGFERAGSSTDSPRSVTCCDICGEVPREPLVLFMSPTRTIGHRKPQEYTACEQCRVAEFTRNR